MTLAIIGELIGKCWPALVVLLAAISGAIWGHRRGTAKAEAKVVVAKTQVAVAEDRARQVEQEAQKAVSDAKAEARKAEAVTNRILFETQHRNQTNAQVADTAIDGVREQLRSDWQRKD